MTDFETDPNYLKMLISEFSTIVRARRNVQAMTGPCQSLQRGAGYRTELPQGKTISHHLLRYKMVN